MIEQIDMKKPLDELTEGMHTGERHNFMYEYAKQNKKKGEKGGCCNVTQCQKEGASSYNGATNAYYCSKCWRDIFKSATYNGLEEVDWIKPEYHELDFTFEHEDSPDILLSTPTISEGQKKLLEEMVSVRGKVRKGMDKSHPLQSLFGSGGKDKGHMPWKREGFKIGRNDQCPCGSGGKYKKCCGGVLGSM